MNVEILDVLASRLQRVGQNGALPTTGPQSLLVDELQRQLSSVKDAVTALLKETRERAAFGKDANLFLIDSRTGSTKFNVLTAADASAEGLGTTDGLAIYRHGKGYALDRAVEVFFALKTRSITVSNGQQQRSGRVLLYAWDDNRTVFQVDDDAQVQEVVAVLACYSSRTIPSAGNVAYRAATGVSTKQLGVVTAGTVQETELP